MDNIKEFIDQHNYDVRISRNARWIDQKCTPDVVEIISDCILNYIGERSDDVEFMSKDIWNEKYSVDIIADLFKKPSPDNSEASNEYDKFFQQPMELLAYSGILNKRKDGNRNVYSVVEKGLLRYIATSARNALSFLIIYISKVLRDSGLWLAFVSFFTEPQTAESYADVKETFVSFTIENTEINNEVECRRIFTKVINPLAYDRSMLGTARGHISRHRITYDMLMYNRDNFRDIIVDKPKELTRKEYEEKIGYNPNPNYYKYESAKAKRQLHEFNDIFRGGKSEILTETNKNEHATQMHHIFPESRYPEISMYLENLIALTPTQHMNYAHSNHNTQIIDREFQRICLYAKSDSIEQNLSSINVEHIYKFTNFQTVLAIGLDCEEFIEIPENDFLEISRQIEVCYGRK